MPQILKNPWRGRGLNLDCPAPSIDHATVSQLLALCPAHKATPLLCVPKLAKNAGVSEVFVKDERGRMELGSFKALGAAYAIAWKASAVVDQNNWAVALSGQTFVTASAGNHGLSVAAGARLFGAQSCIYLSETVPPSFALRLEKMGAQVVRAGTNYEASMVAAQQAAEINGWTLLSDSSWPGYLDLPYRVMEGYLEMASEASKQLDMPPTHILLQAGVGGMAAAVAAFARNTWGDEPQILIVEPEAAPALLESIRAGRVLETKGPVSAMGRLDCKTPSLIALQGLAKDADMFLTISEEQAAAGVEVLSKCNLHTSPSGGAGLSAIIAGLDLGRDARVLSFMSEGAQSTV
jgi:diaminopropionate ammonia-lyase